MLLTVYNTIEFNKPNKYTIHWFAFIPKISNIQYIHRPIYKIRQLTVMNKNSSVQYFIYKDIQYYTKYKIFTNISLL